MQEWFILFPNLPRSQSLYLWYLKSPLPPGTTKEEKRVSFFSINERKPKFPKITLWICSGADSKYIWRSETGRRHWVFLNIIPLSSLQLGTVTTTKSKKILESKSWILSWDLFPSISCNSSTASVSPDIQSELLIIILKITWAWFLIGDEVRKDFKRFFTLMSPLNGHSKYSSNQ